MPQARSLRAPVGKPIHTLGRNLEGPLPIEEWISWVDPKTKEPDFHLPASLGTLKFVK